MSAAVARSDRTYYVYYRVEPAQAPQMMAAATALMDDLRARTGVAGRLAQRQDDAHTWMEIYDGVADSASFGRELGAAVMRHGVARWLATGSARKTEIFAPLDAS